METIINHIIVFICIVLVDIIWVFYIRAVNDEHEYIAGFSAIGIFLSGAYAAIMYIGDNTFLASAILGSFIGTVLAVKIKKRKSLK